MSSISRPERSQITARFRLDRDPDAAANDVRDRVARVRGRLPDEIDEPIVSKLEADAQPIIYLAFSSDRHSPMEVDRLRRPLRQGPAAEPARRRRRARLRRAPLRDAHLARPRAARRLPADAGRRRGRAAPPERRDPGRPHREPGARVHRGHRDRPAHARAVRGHRAARGRRLPVRLGDVGRAELGPENERVNVRFNGRRRGRARHRQAGDRQPARHLRGGARRAAGDPAAICPRACRSTSPTTLDLHPRIDRRGVHRRSPRRSCWWCW